MCDESSASERINEHSVLLATKWRWAHWSRPKGGPVSPRKLAALLGVITLGGSAWWMFLYLSRWEWHRAITAGIFVLASELGLVGGAIITRLGRLEERVDRIATAGPRQQGAAEDSRLLLRAHRPAGSSPFAWLEPDPSRTSVFVPILMGTGFVLSGLAWIVERLARVTARPALERDLARRLVPLAPPFASLVPDETEARTGLAPDDPATRLARPSTAA